MSAARARNVRFFFTISLLDRSIATTRLLTLTSRGGGGNRNFPQDVDSAEADSVVLANRAMKDTRWRGYKKRRQRGNGCCGAADASSTHAGSAQSPDREAEMSATLIAPPHNRHDRAGCIRHESIESLLRRNPSRLLIRGRELGREVCDPRCSCYTAVFLKLPHL